MQQLSKFLQFLSFFNPTNRQNVSERNLHQLHCHCDACRQFNLDVHLDQVRARQLWR